jgi:hypothetical protein
MLATVFMAKALSTSGDDDTDLQASGSAALAGFFIFA